MHTFEFANADFVTDSLLIGGALDDDIARAVNQAVELHDVAGITHVLDVRIEAEESLWDHFPRIVYSWDGIDDRGQHVSAAWFERITAWADAALNAGGTVLTHCHMGVNRGPSAGYAVLLRREWDPVAAIGAIRKARPQAYVAYAEDALEWHLDRIDASPADRARQRARLAVWRAAHPMDVRRAIRNGGRRKSTSAA